jgi:hypothetical protein
LQERAHGTHEADCGTIAPIIGDCVADGQQTFRVSRPLTLL